MSWRDSKKQTLCTPCGEVLGLRWKDVDFRQSVIRIRQQIRRSREGLQPGPVKTSAGRRDLPLYNPVVREVLQAQYVQRVVGGRSAGEVHQNEPSEQLVFTTSVGRPVEPGNLVRSFRRICLGHGLRLIRLHDLRHTVATVLKNAGVPDRDIQLILGHSSVTVTQEIYQHADMQRQREALETVAQLFQCSGMAGDVAVKSSRQVTNLLQAIQRLPLAGVRVSV